MDYNLQARIIIRKHTAGYMSSAIYKPENATELWETMIQECAYILTEDFLNGKYTPMQYNAIRNELANVLNGIFAKDCK